jgi:hypothetical protein
LFGFLLSVSFHCGSPYSYIIWGMNSRPVGGYSSETLSCPIDMNNSISSSHLFIVLPSGLFHSYFVTKILYAFLAFPICATFLTNLHSLDFIILIIFGEKMNYEALFIHDHNYIFI